MQIGIIGGTGRMGSLFGEIFERSGHGVIYSGRSTGTTAMAIAEQCDIIMVSVPIRVTVDVIDKIAPHLSEDQLLCDLTSLKTGPVEAMLRSRAQVIGLHPMFGPSVNSLNGQTIIATPARCNEATFDDFLSIFRKEGAKVTITSPEHHDRIMAVVQGLTHFVTLSFADTMRRIGVSPVETEAYMSPVYQIEMGLVGRLLAQDASLYGDMLQLNPHLPAVLEACGEAVTNLCTIIESGNPDEFIELFEKNQDNFGEYSKKALQETDELIMAMVNP